MMPSRVVNEASSGLEAKFGQSARLDKIESTQFLWMGGFGDKVFPVKPGF